MISSAALAGLSLTVAALFGLGLAGACLPRPRAARICAPGSAILCAAGLVLDLLYLLAGAPPVALTLPLGLPGAATALALDGLSGFFLLLPLGLGVAASAAMQAEPPEIPLPFFPVFLGAMLLALLAGDGFALALGFETMSLAACCLMLGHTGQDGAEDEAARSAALLCFGVAAFGGLCLIAALALLAADAGGWSFAAMRAHPPAGWRAGLVLVLALAGPGSKAGLAPLHVWLPPAHAAAPGPVSALMSGAMTKVALCVLIRLLFDLCGPATPGWWGVPLLVLGAAGAVLGALRANLEDDLKAVLACSTVENIGLMAIGLGLALAARAVDLSSLASLALAGVVLQALAHGLFKGTLFLAAGAVLRGAGTRALARLGGLIARMPLTAVCALAAAASLAGLPPSAGFAGEWLLFQAALGAPRVGGLAWQTLVCLAVALMALTAALAAAAAVRLFGAVFLGRPRTPRTAAAEEAGPGTRWALAGLTLASAAAGLFPGAVLRLADPLLVRLTSTSVADRAGWFLLAPQAERPGYLALAVLALLAIGLGLVALLRRGAAAGAETGAAWECGFNAPPAWLPFGDPATQVSAAGFAQPLRRALGVALLGARVRVDMPAPGETRPARLEASFTDPAERWIFAPLAAARAALSQIADRLQALTIRRILCLMFAVLVLFLVAVAILEQM